VKEGGRGRRYTSTRRAQQALQTRELILDALVNVLAGGLAELSIPAIAREAGVSVSTVYRNFPAKRDLLVALSEHLSRRAGYALEPPPHSPADLERTIRDAYRQADGLSAEIQAAYASAVGQEMRREREVPLKLHIFGEALAPVLGLLPANEQRHLLHLVTILISRYTLQRFKADLAVSADEAAETVVWAVRTLTWAANARAMGNGQIDTSARVPAATAKEGRTP
jgi:AcrR family transcriptional regulator